MKMLVINSGSAISAEFREMLNRSSEHLLSAKFSASPNVRLSVALGENCIQGFQTTFILLCGPDRDADPFWKLVAGHGADDHTLPLQFVKDSLTIANADQDEVGGRGNKFKAQLAESAAEEFEPA
jgi:hypothetical protein